LISAVAGLL